MDSAPGAACPATTARMAGSRWFSVSHRSSCPATAPPELGAAATITLVSRLGAAAAALSTALLSLMSCLRGQRWMPCRRHARFSVVAQMPRRLAASLRPTPNWDCSCSSRRFLPGFPALPLPLPTRLPLRCPAVVPAGGVPSSSLPLSSPMSSSSSSIISSSTEVEGRDSRLPATRPDRVRRDPVRRFSSCCRVVAAPSGALSGAAAMSDCVAAAGAGGVLVASLAA
mmetsp:Transcript_12914/g.39069  ORF Transcript_12914/g.39069 Transcript_12914/m.39069 type:complete len:227 (+) Transcript_12914:196-876(+)